VQMLLPETKKAVTVINNCKAKLDTKGFLQSLQR